MQPSSSSGQHHDRQPTLPTYAEAISASSPTTNLPYSPTVNVGESYNVASAPFYEIPNQSMPIPYATQTNYNQTVFPAVGNYPTTYATNTYPQYGPTFEEHVPAPTTIHIIRPVPTEPTSRCSGRGTRILAIVLSIVILTAILRVTMSPYF